jgi:hypothetical protein
VDPIDLAKRLDDLGPFALGAFFVVIGVAGLFRGVWVPGFIARRDQTRADALQAENLAHIRTNADCAAELRYTKQRVKELERMIAQLQGRDRARGD